MIYNSPPALKFWLAGEEELIEIFVTKGGAVGERTFVCGSCIKL